jgi:hypothetical protein
VIRLASWFVLVVLLAAFAADAARARRFRVDVPIPVRITAYVNEKLEGINPDYEWLVADREGEYMLYVLNLVVMTGSVLPGSINAAVDPYRVKFQLAGAEAALQELRTTPPRRQVVITAYLQFAGGARILMLDKVEAGPESTAAPTSAPESHPH